MNRAPSEGWFRRARALPDDLSQTMEEVRAGAESARAGLDSLVLFLGIITVVTTATLILVATRPVRS